MSFKPRKRSNSTDGLFIVFDGPADAGKSSLLSAISIWLEENNIPTHEVKEPTSEAIGIICREYANKPEHPYTLACLIAAGRYRNIVDEIIPYKSQGYVVLGHRYLASNYVYQVMHGVKREFIDAVNAYIVIPEMTFMVTSSQETIQKRRWEQEPTDMFQAFNYIESETRLFEEATKLLQDRGYPITVVNNDSELANAVNVVRQILQPLLKEKLGVEIKI